MGAAAIEECAEAIDADPTRSCGQNSGGGSLSLLRKRERARAGAPDALSWRERASAESHALAPALASRYAELTVQFGPLFLSCPFARGVPPPRAPTYSRAAVSPGRAQRRLLHAFFDISDRWDLGASRCATERSDFKKSGWNAGGRDHYNVPAPAVAARRRPLGAASRRPHQTLSEAAAAKFRKRQRAAHADSAPLGGRGNMYQTHTRCAMGAGIDLRTACLHLGCHACSAARCS